MEGEGGRLREKEREGDQEIFVLVQQQPVRVIPSSLCSLLLFELHALMGSEHSTPFSCEKSDLDYYTKLKPHKPITCLQYYHFTPTLRKLSNLFFHYCYIQGSIIKKGCQGHVPTKATETQIVPIKNYRVKTVVLLSIIIHNIDEVWLTAASKSGSYYYNPPTILPQHHYNPPKILLQPFPQHQYNLSTTSLQYYYKLSNMTTVFLQHY